VRDYGRPIAWRYLDGSGWPMRASMNRNADYAIAHARIAGIPAARVINCWSDEQLEMWMVERRG
jgi:hypothetical protein